MRSILEEFAYGNINPTTRPLSLNSELGQALELACKNEEALLERLGAEEKEIFKAYTDMHGEVNQLTAVKNLIWGYKLGVLMTAEAFITGGDLITGL